MSVKFVRLKPYKPRAGYKVKRIDWRDPVTGQWFTFARAGIWNMVDAAIADRMALVHQDQYDEGTPLVFDVETEVGARALDAAAKAEREAARQLEEPTVDTAVDLTEKTPASTARAAALDEIDDEPEPVVEPEPKPKPKAARPKRSVKPATRKSRKRK
jgi:hypothetical protein